MHRKINLLPVPIFMGIAFLVLFSSCEGDYTPKPRGFQRFVFEPKTYVPYTNKCGFSFDLPDYALVVPDYLSGQIHDCWYNIYYKPFNATLHLSYNPIRNNAEYIKLSEDARTLVYKHTVKADEIYETYIENAHVKGMVYELSGNTATSFQFYVTDSTKNYIRGALYFNVQTNTDSVAPVLAYLEKDIYKMIETLRWTK
ncbi:MAG: gliding motility lipoprotein GldD [Bacteroidota bacterium]